MISTSHKLFKLFSFFVCRFQEWYSRGKKIEKKETVLQDLECSSLLIMRIETEYLFIYLFIVHVYLG